MDLSSVESCTRKITSDMDQRAEAERLALTGRGPALGDRLGFDPSV